MIAIKIKRLHCFPARKCNMFFYYRHKQRVYHKQQIKKKSPKQFKILFPLVEFYITI